MPALGSEDQMTVRSTQRRPMPSPLAYSVNEATQALPVSRSTLFAMIAAGKIRTVTIGRRRLIPASELARLADEGVE